MIAHLYSRRACRTVIIFSALVASLASSCCCAMLVRTTLSRRMASSLTRTVPSWTRSCETTEDRLLLPPKDIVVVRLSCEYGSGLPLHQQFVMPDAVLPIYSESFCVRVCATYGGQCLDLLRRWLRHPRKQDPRDYPACHSD
jgi:hypothetical protein